MLIIILLILLTFTTTHITETASMYNKHIYFAGYFFYSFSKFTLDLEIKSLYSVNCQVNFHQTLYLRKFPDVEYHSARWRINRIPFPTIRNILFFSFVFSNNRHWRIIFVVFEKYQLILRQSGAVANSRWNRLVMFRYYNVWYT